MRVGAVAAPVTLSPYEDFSCPHCQTYEGSIGDTLDDLVATGDVAVEYHPARIVTGFGNSAGSIVTCVTVGAPDSWHDVHRTLFALRDATTDGWSNAQLRDQFAGEGISDEAVLDCTADGRYESWIGQNTQTAAEAGVTSTPTLHINDERSETLAPAQLRDAVGKTLAAE